MSHISVMRISRVMISMAIHVCVVLIDAKVTKVRELLG